jgi:3-phosphoshikimate 1-carboxyvinyltransferase
VENLVSRSYVELTCAMMAEFGVEVRVLNANEFVVVQPQRYQARRYAVEPDLSTASYFLAAAAVTASVLTLPAIQRKKTKQGDVLFLAILEQMGCMVQETATGLTLQGPTSLQGLEVNLNACPDLFMTLAALAPFAQTPTLIHGIGHARYKESNRITAMQNGLETLGVRVEVGADFFKIYPSMPHGGIIHSENDHRIAMAFSIMALRIPQIEIMNTDCVAKSCPEFFELWRAFLS